MLPEKIYTLRRRNGLSQEQLAEKLGVSRQAVSKWESGSATPELEKLLALSACFQITLDELVTEKPMEHSTEEAPEPAPQSSAAGSGAGRTGIALCLLGAVGLILTGLLVLLRPDTAEQLNASSAVTLNGTGILMFLCVAVMAVGLVLMLRRK